MKKVLKKLFGREPMSAEEREAVAMLPVVLVFGWLCLAMAVVLG